MGEKNTTAHVQDIVTYIYVGIPLLCMQQERRHNGYLFCRHASLYCTHVPDNHRNFQVVKSMAIAFEKYPNCIKNEKLIPYQVIKPTG